MRLLTLEMFAAVLVQARWRAHASKRLASELGPSRSGAAASGSAGYDVN
jgi:hypothetical protein